MAFSVDLLSSRDLHNLKNHENRCTVVQNRRSTKRHQAYDPEVLDLDFAYFGVPMGDVFGYFWTPFRHRFFEGFRNLQKSYIQQKLEVGSIYPQFGP